MKPESAVYKGFYFEIELLNAKDEVKCHLMKENRFFGIRIYKTSVGLTLWLILSETEHNPTCPVRDIKGVRLVTYVRIDRMREFLFEYLIKWKNHHDQIEKEKKELLNEIIKS